jgi:DNA-binding response OmpR family regulator
MQEHAQSGPRARFLIVEDDLPLARLLSRCLQGEDYATELAHDGAEALERLRAGAAAPERERFDLLLLDLGLPGRDGLSLLPELRRELPELPVMVLTGRSGTAEMVQALNSGADDYLTKPFSVEELLARVRALLRRRAVAGHMGAAAAGAAGRGLTLDRETHRVQRCGREIELTPREFALLEYLMQNAPKPVSRSVLMEQVWRVPFDPKTNVVDVYMKYLRDKLDVGEEPKLIRTVRGVGYALAAS